MSNTIGCQSKPADALRDFLDCYVSLGVATYPGVTITNACVSLANLPRDHAKSMLLGEQTKAMLNTIEEEEEDMSYDAFNDQDTNARQYIEGRLMQIYHNKSGALQRDFGLVDDERPTTAKELITRITEGKFKVSADKMEKDSYSPMDYFRWRDPSVKEDRAGFNTALVNMNEAKTEVQDTIMVGTPADALTALKAFESKTFH